MARFVLLTLMIAATAALSGPSGSAKAEQRVTRDQLEELQNRLADRRNAYRRLEQAEQEALADGSPERAAVYREARAKELDSYDALNAQLQKVQALKNEQDAREAQINPDYR